MSEYKNRNRIISFETQMMNKGRLPNLFCASILGLFTLYLTDIPYSTLSAKTIFLVFITPVVLMFFMQFLIAPRTNHIITNQISKLLDKELKDKLDINERTSLLKKLLKCPVYISLQVFLVFIITCLLCLFIYSFIFHIEMKYMLFAVVTSIFGSYQALLLSYNYSFSLCSNFAKNIVKKGIDNSFIQKKHNLGFSYNKLIILYIIIPIILINIINFIFYLRGFDDNYSIVSFKIKTFVILIVNSSSLLILSSILVSRIYKKIKQMNLILENINIGKLDSSLYLPTDLYSELDYNIYLANQIIANLNKISDDTIKTSDSIIIATRELSNSAKLISTKSDEQSENLKQKVLIMRKAKESLHITEERIDKVTKTAEATLTNVNEGTKLLTTNMSKMAEITDANIETITGIKNLSEKIDNVWNLVNTIDKLAEKTRIIAFNAELESYSGGENSENFHIVAAEIRRLAESITFSTNEIRDKITSIQHSSDNLIIASEGGTERIHEGNELFINLEEKLTELKTSCEITFESTENIQSLINSQTESFSEITSTMQQVSIGFDNFNQAAKTTSEEADNLKKLSNNLLAING